MIKSEKQKRVLNFIENNEGATISEIEMLTDCSRAIVNTLIKNDYLEIIEKKIQRDPLKDKKVEKTEKLILTKEQEKAYEKVVSCIEHNQYQEFLLYGVTGSGKTEVYLQLIQEVIEKENTAIVLVPEISLTPQMLERFISRFGKERIAVLHSKLSIGERYDEWNKIREGKAKIVIGARSAIFAPVKNLGIIMIDEEHDSSYKSESNPKYDAKQVAKFIAKQNNCPLLLGSATPDINTYYKAVNTNKIELLKLTKRANASSLPKVTVVDLKQELANRKSIYVKCRFISRNTRKFKAKKANDIIFKSKRIFYLYYV
ncbi:MAG: primosomal protein N' [Clostridia bacterium]|nr:primosomal protein N' [Clostridia bacterium]